MQGLPYCNTRASLKLISMPHMESYEVYSRVGEGDLERGLLVVLPYCLPVISQVPPLLSLYLTQESRNLLEKPVVAQ
jgi:hypothetical protein